MAVTLSSGCVNSHDLGFEPEGRNTLVPRQRPHRVLAERFPCQCSTHPVYGASVLLSGTVLLARRGCSRWRRSQRKWLLGQRSLTDVAIPGSKDPWTEAPARCILDGATLTTAGTWKGIEQTGTTPKPGGGSRHYHLAQGVASPQEITSILKCLSETCQYEVGPDIVDGMATFEFYPFMKGEWVDERMRNVLEDIMESRVLPYVRERYHRPSCAVADILVRRYMPGERRTHPVHFDGHAFVTAVLGLSDPDTFEGGLYLQPGSSSDSRIFPQIAPGDLLVHSFDLLHGVHVWGGERYSLIFWIKDSPDSVETGSTPWYEAPAAAGDVDAMHHLAENFEHGQYNFAQDLDEAVRWYEKSASAGHVHSQNNLASLYQRLSTERPAKKSEYTSKALKWLRLSAESGSALGQINLSIVYADGRGVPEDPALAFHWMRKAAEQLDIDAAYHLGGMLGNGEGTEQNVSQAVWWMERAAGAGHTLAQWALGKLLLTGGRDVPQNPEAGEYWLLNAAAGGCAAAARDLANLLAERGEEEAAASVLRQVGAGRRLRSGEDSHGGEGNGMHLACLRYSSAVVEFETVALEEGDAAQSMNPSILYLVEDLEKRANLLGAAIDQATSLGLMDIQFQLMLDLAQCCDEMGNLDAARELLDGLLEDGNDSEADMEKHAIVLNNYAVSMARAEGDFEQAEELLIDSMVFFEIAHGLAHEGLNEIADNLNTIRALTSAAP